MDDPQFDTYMYKMMLQSVVKKNGQDILSLFSPTSKLTHRLSFGLVNNRIALCDDTVCIYLD